MSRRHRNPGLDTMSLLLGAAVGLMGGYVLGGQSAAAAAALPAGSTAPAGGTYNLTAGVTSGAITINPGTLTITDPTGAGSIVSVSGPTGLLAGSQTAQQTQQGQTSGLGSSTSVSVTASTTLTIVWIPGGTTQNQGGNRQNQTQNQQTVTLTVTA